MTSSAIVQKLRNYRNILRDDLSAVVAQASGDYPSAPLRTACLCGHADRALSS